MLDLPRLHSLLGDRIRRVRETQSPPMSQGRLAEILHLQRTSITNIEGGRQKPSLETLYRFCEYFGLAIGEFLPVVADVALAESESMIIGSQQVQVGAKTADVIHELRAQQRVDATVSNSTRPEDE